MLKFRYEKNQSLNRWLVSDIKESYYYSESRIMEGFQNTGAGFILSEYPCRTQFLEDKKISRVSYQESKKSKFQLYVPFENKKVEFSRFIHEPTYIRFFSKNIIYTEKTKEIPFKIGTTGGLKIWINGNEVHTFTPYNRNHMTYEIINLSFQKGENEIVIYCDDLAERDINFYFEIIPLEDIDILIPIEGKQENIQNLESFLQEMYFSKDCYASEDVYLMFSNSMDKDLKINFSLKSADPVNLNRVLVGDTTLKKGETILKLFNTNDFPIGFYKIFISSVIEGVIITRMLTMENYNFLNVPEFKDIQDRKKYALEHISEHGDDTLDKVLALLLTSGFSSEAEELFEQEIKLIENNFDCADFSLFTLIYLYKNCRKMLPKSVHTRIKNALLNFRYWIDEPGNDCMWYFSENHALCLHGGEFLVGELFPGELFSRGLTGDEHRKKGKVRLIEWFQEFFKYGLGEWNSVTYIPIDLIGFFGLNILTSDEEIKKLSKKALDYIFNILAENFHSGITSSSYGRVYEKELKGQLTNECSSLNWIAFGNGYLNNKLRASTLFAISSYEVPEDIFNKTIIPSTGKRNLSTQGKELVKLYSFKTQKYSISSAVDYRRGDLGHQESLIHVNIADSPKSQLWINHPGEEVPSGEGRPSYWAGNGRLPNLLQKDNIIFMDYDVQSEDRVQFTHMYCDIESYDHFTMEKNRIFLHKNGVNILIVTKFPVKIIKDGPTKLREIRVESPKNYWFILADDKLCFENFCDKFALTVPEEVFDIKFTREAISLDGEEYLKLWTK